MPPFPDFQMTDEEIELVYERTLRELEPPTDFFIPLSQWEPVDPDWFWLYEPQPKEE